MNTMTDFLESTAKIMAEIRTRACIDDVDVEVIEAILQDALKGYYNELQDYYEEEYHNALNSARSRAYDAGYEDGYEEGYSESHSEE